MSVKTVKNIIVRGFKFVESPIGGILVDAAAKIIAAPIAIDTLTVEIKDKGYEPYKYNGIQSINNKISSYNLLISRANKMLKEKQEGLAADFASYELLSYQDEGFQMSKGFESILNPGVSAPSTFNPGSKPTTL